MRVVLLLLAIAPLCFPAQKKGKLRPAEIEVVELAAHRTEGILRLDGKIRNRGERPAIRLVLMFDLTGTSKEPIATKRGGVETELLAPGEEAEFHLEMQDPVRAVHVTIRTEDGDGRDLKTIKPGPFPIE